MPEVVVKSTIIVSGAIPGPVIVEPRAITPLMTCDTVRDVALILPINTEPEIEPCTVVVA